MKRDTDMPSPIKVLHVIPSVGMARGGPSVVVRTLAQHQSNAGAEVHVACTDDDGKGHLNASDQLFAESNVRYWIFKRQARPYVLCLPLARWLRKHAQDYHLIHVHALFSHTSVAAARAARRAHVPYIIEPHGLLNRWGMEMRRPLAKAISFRLVERPILERAAAVLYSSQQEFLEARLLRMNHQPLVIPNPVEIAPDAMRRGSFRSANPELANRPLILFLSRLDPKKGIDLLLSAFAQVRKNSPDAILLMGGNGDAGYVEGLKRSAAMLGCADAVRWLGFLGGDRKISVLADADVFVLPSYSENFGVAVVEAMAAGVPVIVTDQVGLHQEISAAQAGFVVKCNAPELAETIRRSLDSRQLRAALGANGRKLAVQFSPETIAKRLLLSYQEILAGRREVAAA